MKYLLLLSMILLIAACSAKKKLKSMDNPMQPKVYIGYYLKTTDNLLTESMDKIHKANNLTRAEWQVLNAIAEVRNVHKDTLLQTVKEFTNAEIAGQVINNLILKGLVENPDRLNLTEQGQKLHARSLQMQKEFRINAMKGISEEEYQNVITTLDKMIQNLKQL